MKLRCKKLIALVGAIALVASQNGLTVAFAANEIENESVVNSDEKTSTDEGITESTDDTTNSTKDENGEGENNVDKESDGEEANGEEATEEIALLSDEVEVQSDSELKPVSDIKWVEDKPGRYTYSNNNDFYTAVACALFRDGEFINGFRLDYKEAKVYEMYTQHDINETGKYVIKMKVFAKASDINYNFKEDGWVEGDVYDYTRPDEQVGIPTNIKISPSGVISWDAVENAAYYESDLYRKDDSAKSGYRQIMGFTGGGNSGEDYSSYLGEGYDYYVRVRAISNNIEEIANGEWSDYISVSTTQATTEINDSIDKITSEYSSATEQVSALKSDFASDSDKGKLRVAMQTDSTTHDKIASLESAYETETGIRTSVDSSYDEIDSNKVEVLGASLNATEGEVKFNLSKADEATQEKLLTKTSYTNAIVLDLGLTGTGITKGETLAIPVTVTMPKPLNIDINKLVVLHYSSDDAEPETITVRENKDGTISFTVTHFSSFLFAEKTENASVTSPSTSNNSSSSDNDSSSASSSESESSSESDSESTVTKTVQPTIGTSKGWDSLSNEVNKAISEATTVGTTAVVNINLNGTNVIPATAISAIAGKNVLLSVSVDKNTLITIDGSKLALTDAADVKFSTVTSKDGSSVLAVRTQNLDLEKNIVIYANMGTDKVGSETVLYFVDADNSLIPFRTSPVFENGYVAFVTPFVNANYNIK